MEINLDRLQTQTPKWILHLSFWFIYISTAVIVSGSINGNYATSLQWELTFWPIKAAAVYTMIRYLLPLLLEKGRYMAFLVLIILLLLASGVLIMGTIEVLSPVTTYPALGQNTFFLFQAARYGSHVYPVMALMGSIQIFLHFVKKQNESEKQTFQRTQAELKLLKAQINPHFLFNSLNNLYSLTLKRSPDASKITLTLSEMLRYMIYECSDSRVPLSKEVKVIENYLTMEKIRLGERVQVSFHVEGEIQPDMVIAPMIMLPLIENCFKHGVAEAVGGYVNIDLVVGDQLILKVDNSKSKKARQTSDEGMGLDNVKRRLELEYSGKYNFQIIEDENSYLVVLKVNLPEPEKP